MIYIFPIGSSLKYSPFNQKACKDFFRNEGIEIVDKEELADVVVSATIPRLIPSMMRCRSSKRYLAWSNEPRFIKTFSPKISFPALPEIHVVNMYTTDFFQHNYAWIKPNLEIKHIHDVDLSKPKAVALMQFRNEKKKWSFKYKGKELDLCYLRTQIAIKGYEAGLFDVYGRNWPEEIKKGQSRGGEWRKKKLEILKSYHYNLAFENTNWPYYCTEKIWDSIIGGCLPIYYGEGNCIYEDFPEESFIDYARINDVNALIDLLTRMSKAEYIRRINRCIDAFNEASQKRAELDEIAPSYSLKVTARRIREIAASASN
jgi:hypothetical protein